MCSAQYYKFNANDKCHRCQIFRTFSDEFSSNNNNSSSDSKLLLWAIKSEFRPSFSRGIDNKKDQLSKKPVRKYKQNIPVCVAERVLLNIRDFKIRDATAVKRDRK